MKGLTRRALLSRVAGASLAGGLAMSGCIPLDRREPDRARARPFDLADLEQRTFRWFWDVGDAVTGLVPDRWPSKSFCSIAAVGFALTAYPIGIEHGWITREQGRDRTLATLRFFANAKQGAQASGVTGYKGFFYHFIDMAKGERFETVELSSIDTTLLLGGMLFAAGWFDRDDADEREIRDLANRIYARVDWQWMAGQRPFVSMGWTPENGFIASQWDRYNEAMLLYLLAFASPTHPIDPAYWQRLSRNFDLNWGRHWGEDYIDFPPLFGHQYSHVWVDFRGIGDAYIRSKGIDYFENSRRATRAQRNYAIQNPGGWAGYDKHVWGLTACDGPGDFTTTIGTRPREFFSYSARGPGDRDDGTLAPTALGGSIAFAPEIVEPALAAMVARYGAAIYTRYGFLDSFNPTLADPALTPKLAAGRIIPGVGWVDTDYLGIDQGPIIAMIANHRRDAVWRVMRRSPPIIAGLRKAGFTGGWLDAAR